MKNNQERKTKIKLSISFIAAFALVLAGFIYIFIKTSDIVAPTKEDRLSVYKLQIINEVSARLIDADLHANTNSANFDEEKYSLLCDTIKSKLSLLGTVDTSLTPKTDSIKLLLDNKQIILKQLYPLLNGKDIIGIYKSTIKNFIENEKLELKNHLNQHKTQVKTDTILYLKPSEKRSFFKRLSSLFSEPDQDTAVKITHSETIQTDSTLSFYNPADTLSKLFDNIHSSANNEKKAHDIKLLKKIKLLESTEKELSSKLKLLITEIETKELNASVASINKKEETLNTASMAVLFGLALSAILIGFLMWLIFKDINKSQRQKKELEIAREKAVNLLNIRKKITMGITHDIKAPLSSIIGYIELLKNTKLTERQQYYADNTKTSAEHILKLVNNILEFNKLEDGKVSLNLIDFSPNSLFREIYDTFLPTALSKNIKLKLANNLADNITVNGDPLRIKQITSNLVNNAIKFTNQGEVNIAVSHNDEYLTINVTDTGIGIKEKNLENIFKEYTRADDEQTNKTEGFGLGLSITKLLTELHGGKISVLSTYGSGSSFCAKIKAPITQNKLSTNIETEKESIKNILIIDDDELHLTMLCELLKQENIDCVSCSSPINALSIAETTNIDLIFTDIQMPEMNGPEFVKRLRSSSNKKLSSVPVIALSAQAEFDEARMKSEGFSYFLEKPVTKDKIISAIKKYYNINTSNKDAYSSDCRFKCLLEFAGGDKNAENLILNSFVTENERNLAELKSYLNNNDYDNISKMAHKMLAIFKMLGSNNLINALSNLEKNNVQNDLSFLKEIEDIINEAKQHTQQENKNKQKQN